MTRNLLDSISNVRARLTRLAYMRSQSDKKSKLLPVSFFIRGIISREPMLPLPDHSQLRCRSFPQLHYTTHPMSPQNSLFRSRSAIAIFARSHSREWDALTRLARKFKGSIYAPCCGSISPLSRRGPIDCLWYRSGPSCPPEVVVITLDHFSPILCLLFCLFA